MESFEASAGALVGLAIGDALGAPVEFTGSVAEMVDRLGPFGGWRLVGPVAAITDDTQMTLALGRALVVAAEAGITPASVEASVRAEFVAWLHSPDNDRAPGMTCLDACGRLEQGLAWVDATVAGSKGCGANMRVAPVGLLRHGWGALADDDLTPLAQFTRRYPRASDGSGGG